MKPWSKFIAESTGKDPITGAPIKNDPVTGQPNFPSTPATSGSKSTMTAAEKRRAAEQIINDLRNQGGQKKKSQHQEYLERVQAFKEKKYKEQKQRELENKRLKQEKDKKRKEKELENRKKQRETARRAITSNIPIERIGERDPGATAYAKAVGNVGSFTGAVAKRVGAIAMDKMKEKKEAQKNAGSSNQQQGEITSNQPERRKRNPAGRPPKAGASNVSEAIELIVEIEKEKKEKGKRIIDVMRGKNTKVIEINPNISEDHKEIASGKKKDDEGYMANVELDQMERAIKALRKKVKKSDTQLPAWVQSKITRAADYIDTASEYMQSDETLGEGNLNEIAPLLATLGRVALGAGARTAATSGARAAVGSELKDLAKEKLLNIAKEKLANSVSNSLDTAGQKVGSGFSSGDFESNESGASAYKKALSKIVGESVDKSAMKCNKPKAQAHGSGETGKSHIVKACEGGTEKIIRFGQLGVKGSPKKEGESEAYASRRHRFQTRHAKNIAKGKMSAAYWANKVKW